MIHLVIGFIYVLPIVRQLRFYKVAKRRAPFSDMFSGLDSRKTCCAGPAVFSSSPPVVIRVFVLFSGADVHLLSIEASVFSGGRRLFLSSQVVHEKLQQLLVEFDRALNEGFHHTCLLGCPPAVIVSRVSITNEVLP